MSISSTELLIQQILDRMYEEFEPDLTSIRNSITALQSASSSSTTEPALMGSIPLVAAGTTITSSDAVWEVSSRKIALDCSTPFNNSDLGDDWAFRFFAVVRIGKPAVGNTQDQNFYLRLYDAILGSDITNSELAFVYPRSGTITYEYALISPELTLTTGASLYSIKSMQTPYASTSAPWTIQKCELLVFKKPSTTSS